MATNALQVIQDMYEAFSRGDVPAVLGAYDSQMVWEAAEHSPYADRSPYVGPEQILQGVFARIMGDWDGFTVDVEEFIIAGNRVVALGHYRGTHKVSGQAINAQFAHIWTVENGKVTRFQQYTDTLQLAQARAGSTMAPVSAL